MRIKTFILTFLLIFVLYSCWWDNSNNNSLQTNENEYYSIDIPSEWNVLSKDEDNIPNPKNWEITLAARSEELKYGFSNNILILTQALNKSISSDDFSIYNHVWATKEYDEYQKLDSKKIEFNDWEEASLYIFEAKYNQDTATLKFLQTWKVCNSYVGHLITIALSTDTEDISPYEEIIKSFSCK